MIKTSTRIPSVAAGRKTWLTALGSLTAAALMGTAFAPAGSSLGTVGLGVTAANAKTLIMCVNKKSGNARVVPKTSRCKRKRERVVKFNSTGPIGPTGPAGPQGPEGAPATAKLSAKQLVMTQNPAGSDPVKDGLWNASPSDPCSNKPSLVPDASVLNRALFAECDKIPMTPIYEEAGRLAVKVGCYGFKQASGGIVYTTSQITVTSLKANSYVAWENQETISNRVTITGVNQSVRVDAGPWETSYVTSQYNLNTIPVRRPLSVGTAPVGFLDGGAGQPTNIVFWDLSSDDQPKVTWINVYSYASAKNGNCKFVGTSQVVS